MLIRYEELMSGSDIQSLRELLNFGILDTYWYLGVGTMHSQWKLTGEESRQPLVDPSLSILVRFLSKFPEFSFMPEFPNFYETFDRIVKICPTLFQDKRKETKTSVRRFAPLFGKNSWSSSQWEAGKVTSPVVSRLFLLVKKSIENEGMTGLERYLNVVEIEAKGRGIKNLDNLLSIGAWKTNSFRKQVHEKNEEFERNHQDKNNNAVMRGADIQALRELLGLGFIDTYWLSGIGNTNSTWKLTGDESQKPIFDPSLSILVRFLLKYPELTFMPEFPSFQETFSKLAETSAELFKNKINVKKISVRRFAPLFGKNSWSSSQWKTGESPSPVVLRLFSLVLKAIEIEGEGGLKKYLSVVEEEAQARGLKNLNSLLSTGTWQSKTFKAAIKEKYGEPKNKKKKKP